MLVLTREGEKRWRCHCCFTYIGQIILAKIDEILTLLYVHHSREPIPASVPTSFKFISALFLAKSIFYEYTLIIQKRWLTLRKRKHCKTWKI